jgi:outer membrane immunogenic protein
MKKLLLGSIALLAVTAAGSASAADLPVRAPLPMPVCTWCGFYMGFTVGDIWGNFHPTSSADTATYLGADNVPAVNATGQQSLKPNSITGGITAGYNWQSGNIVFGIELDMQAYRLAGTVINSGAYPTSPALSYTFTTAINSNWLFTARPRIGLGVNNWLFYVTGGLAVTDLSATFMWGDNNPPTGFAESAAFNKIKVGYAVGGGVEAAIAQRWTLKAEYLYVGFGNESVTGNMALQGYPGQVFTHTADLKASIARVGANYRY